MRACPSACRPGRRGPRAPWDLRAGLIRIPGEAEVREGDASAPGDLADDSGLDVRPEGPDDAFRLLLWCNDCEAHAHVERLIHLAVFDSTERLELVEDRLRLERLRNPEFHAALEPHEVPHAAPGDVGHPVEVGAPDRPENRSDIDCHGLEEFLTPCPPRAPGGGGHREGRPPAPPPRAGPRADADHVVHVMLDAVDPARVPAAHLPRDERLRADAVRAERQRVGAQVNESGEVADLREGLSDASTSVREGGDEGGDVRGLFVLAYAGLGIGADHIAPKRPRLFQPYAGRGPVNMLSR